MAVALEIPELTTVAWTRAVGGYPRGTVGVVVSADARSDSYLVEITDGAGHTIDLVDAGVNDLHPMQTPLTFLAPERSS